MAWISVHEQVIGGKLRKLAKEIGCSQNEALGLLVRLWLWGINNADKDGMIIGADIDDVAEVLAIGINPKFEPEDVIEALVTTEWLDVNEGIYIHDWAEWQEQWYKAIATREKNAKRKREERARKRDDKTQDEVIKEEKPDSGLPTPRLNIPTEPEEKKKTEATEYPDGFNQFWDVYPRKVGKGDAYKTYKARINCGWKPEELLEAAKTYASKVARERTEKQYIKHPKTFLSSSEPFVDYLPKQETKPITVGTNEDDPYADWR